MARVLISFLGKGALAKDTTSRRYLETNYRFEGSDEEFHCSFVAAAIHDKFRVDRTILLGTVHSMWDEVYACFGTRNGTFDEEVWCAISDACNKADHTSELRLPHVEHIEAALGNGSKAIPIRYGLNKEEIRENSDIILGLEQYLNRGDELIIDITHSFRSLPMYVMNLLIYLRDVSSKKIRIGHICYGMLEVKGELGYSPVIEMNDLLEVNAWITGAYSFLEFGNAYKIAELVGAVDASLKKRLIDFSDVKNLNHLTALENQCQQLQAVRSNEHLPRIAQMVITPVIGRFLDRMNIRRDNPHGHSDFQYHLACWQNDNRNYVAAYISLNEAIVTRACEQTGIDPLEYDNREGMKEEFRNLRRGGGSCRDLKPLAYLYKDVSLKRNAIAHNMRGSADNPQSMIRDLAGYLDKYRDLTC